MVKISFWRTRDAVLGAHNTNIYGNFQIGVRAVTMEFARKSAKNRSTSQAKDQAWDSRHGD
jgi:hypothetical protein